MVEKVEIKTGQRIECWGLTGERQSRARERIRRALQRLLPDFDFTRYPVQSLRPYQRDGELPAWSVGAKRKADGKYFDVYCHDTMSDCFLFGLKVAVESYDSIQIMADWPERISADAMLAAREKGE